jgi:hypothetical protein
VTAISAAARASKMPVSMNQMRGQNNGQPARRDHVGEGAGKVPHYGAGRVAPMRPG